MINRFAILLLFLFPAFIFSQAVKFAWPLDSPYVLTANYGELRPNHFHAGLDFSTGGQVNLPVYSAAEGYVSRIKISSTGYGKCIYITHPNGKVTLYGHMNSYSLKIASIVSKEQFAKQSFEVEIFPKPATVFVRKGEILGLSGSTGSSTGPHLHFEVRDEKTEAPLNPLEYYRLFDLTRPMIQSVALYNLSDTLAPKFFRSIRVIQNEDDVLLPENSLVSVDHSILGVSFSGIDRFTPAGSPNNIYSVKLYFDGRLVYGHKLSGIKFEDTRYINEYSETQGGVKYQKCFLPTLYPKEFITKSINKGRIILKDSNFHMIKLVVNDEFGNQNDVQFHVRANKISQFSVPPKGEPYVKCDEDFIIRKEKLYVHIPAGSFFYSLPLFIENTIDANGRLYVFPSEINLKNAITFGFRIPGNYMKSRYKLILKNGSAIYSSVIRKDSVFFDVKGLGTFQLDLDQKPPKIASKFNSRKQRNVAGLKHLAFVITDALSGIAKYKLFLNNQWVLAEYDAKYDLLTYYFDEESPKGKINLRLEVEDKVGNKSKFECSVRR